MKVLGLVLVATVVSSMAYAEDKPETGERKNASDQEQSTRIFDIKVPPGFELQPAEEPGIFRWTKNSAEILAVVGDVFLGSGDLLFDSLRTSAKKGKQYEKVQSLSVRGAKAMLLIEKTPEDPARLQTWTLVVVTDKKIIDIDFSAPAKEFQSLASEFKKSVKSFKLRPAS
jgi:hypothetical protein